MNNNSIQEGSSETEEKGQMKSFQRLQAHIDDSLVDHNEVSLRISKNDLSPASLRKIDTPNFREAMDDHD